MENMKGLMYFETANHQRIPIQTFPIGVWNGRIACACRNGKPGHWAFARKLKAARDIHGGLMLEVFACFCFHMFSCCFLKDYLFLTTCMRIDRIDYMCTICQCLFLFFFWEHHGASRRQEKQRRRKRALTRQVWSHGPGLGHGCGFGFCRCLE